MNSLITKSPSAPQVMSAWPVNVRRAPPRDCWGCKGLWSYERDMSIPSPLPLPPPTAPETQSQALLRTLSEQKSNVRELVLQERRREAELTASRLDSARAEALAERSAAEIDGLRDSKVRSVSRSTNQA